MEKINIKRLFLSIIITIAICVLKNPYINSINDDNESIYNLFIFWGNQQIINLIWFLPILLNLYIIGKKYYYKFLDFNPRYKNRNKYIRKILISYINESILFNVMIIIIQLFYFTLINHIHIILTFKEVEIIFKYVIEMLLLNFIIALIYLYLKNYIYSFLSLIILLVVGLNISIKDNSLPFINMFYNIKINYLTVLFIIFIGYCLKKKYLKSDFGGV